MCTDSAVEHKPEMWKSGPRSHILDPPKHRAGCSVRASLGLVHTPGSAGACPRSLHLVGKVGLLFANRILCPLNHALFTPGHGNEQLFPLLSIFKMKFWTPSIWMPKGCYLSYNLQRCYKLCDLCSHCHCLKILADFFLPIHTRSAEDIFLFHMTDSKLSLKSCYFPRKLHYTTVCVWHDLHNLSQGNRGVV